MNPERAAPVPDAGTSSDGLSRLDFWLLALITLGGFLLRIYRIDFREANLDEAYTMRVVRTPLWREFFSSLLTVDCHPPISYLVQKFFYWVQPTLAAVRTASVLIGTAAIPCLYWALRPLLGRQIALASAFLAATSYILVWYSRVARNYALFFILSVLMFGFFVRLLMSRTAREEVRYLWRFVLATLACLFTHHATLLMLPIFATIFFLWEGMNHRFRRTLLIRLALVAAFLVAAAIPVLYQLNAWSFDHFAHERLRPSVSQLMALLASVGWGSGWRFVLWSLTLLLGFLAIRKRSPPLAATLACWILFPFSVYLLLVGMAPKFLWYFYRYVLFIQIGLLAFVAACAMHVAGRLDAIRIAGRRWLPFSVIILLLVGVRLGVLWKPFSFLYRLKANKHSHETIVTALRSVPFRRVLVDNFYYVTGTLRQYKPDDIRIAYPPVFNNEADYSRFGVASFIRESCEKDPLLGYFGTGIRYDYSQTNMTWEWMNRHFTQKAKMANPEGYELAKMGLNYFTFLNVDMYFRYCLYYNTLEDLPGWYAARGETLGAGYGEGWHPVSLFTQPAWKMWYCMEQDAAFYLYNAGPPVLATLSFNLQACAALQHLNILQGTNRVFDLDLKMPAVMLHALSGEPPVEAYVSFPRLIQANEGIMPYFAGFVFSTGHAVTLPFRVPHGVSYLSLRSSDKEGLMVSDLTIARAPQADAPAGPGRAPRP